MNDFKRLVKGVLLRDNNLGPNALGDISGSLTSSDNGAIYNYQNILRTFLSGSQYDILTNSQTQTVTNKTIDADLNTISNIDDGNIKSGAAIDAAKIHNGTVSNTEFGYLDGVTSSIQDQLDDKALDSDLNNHITDTSTHGVTGDILGSSDTQTITNKTIDADLNTVSNIDNGNIKSGADISRDKIAPGTAYRLIINGVTGYLSEASAITADRALISNADGIPTHSTTTATELGYVSGVTSSIQTQLNAKATTVGTSTDNAIVRFDGTAGAQQNSGVLIDDSNNVIVGDLNLNFNGSIQNNDTNVVEVLGQAFVEDGVLEDVIIDSTTTGSNATVNLGKGGIVSLNNSSLISVSTIVGGGEGSSVTLLNFTTNPITIKNSGALYTGTGQDIILQNSASLILKELVDDLFFVVGGSGSGSSDTSDIINLNFESDIEGFITYADAAGTRPVDGTGGSPNVTFTRSTTLPLSGIASGLLTKDAANRQGQGASVDFSIQPYQKGRKILVKFPYESSTNFVTGDIGVYIYDVTNGQLLSSTGHDIGASSSGYHYATFQSSIDSSDYRLIFHVASTNASAYTLKIDEVNASLQTMVYGAYERSELIDLTGQGNFTSGTIRVSRIGDSVTVAQETAINFPSNTSPTASGVIPVWARPSDRKTNVFTVSSTLLYSMFVDEVGALTFVFRNTSFTATAQTTIAAPDATISYSVDNLISSTQVSQDFGGNPAKFRILGTGTQSIANNTITKLTLFNSISTDSVAGWSAANNNYVIQKDGDYVINGAVPFAVSSTGTRYLYYAVNNTTVATLSSIQGSITNAVVASGSDTVSLLKGDVVDLRVLQSSGGALSTVSVSPTQPYFSIYEYTNGSTLLETEMVAASYSTNAGQTILNNTDTDIVFEDINFDTHNAYNTTTGQYTVPYDGLWEFSCFILFASASYTDAQRFILRTEVNATVGTYLDRYEINGSTTEQVKVSGKTLLKLNSGDVVTFNVTQNSGASKTLDTTASTCTMYIKKIK